MVAEKLSTIKLNKTLTVGRLSYIVGTNKKGYMMKINKDDLRLIIRNLYKSSGRLDYKSDEYKEIYEMIEKLEKLESEIMDYDNLILEVE